MAAQALEDALEANAFILTLAQAEQDRIDAEQAAQQQRAEALAGFSCPQSVYPASISVFEFPFQPEDSEECRTAIQQTLDIYNTGRSPDGRVTATYSDFIGAEAE